MIVIIAIVTPSKLCVCITGGLHFSNTMLEIIANSLSHSMSLETLSLKEKVSVHIIRVWGPQLKKLIETYMQRPPIYIGFGGISKGGWHISKRHSQYCILRSCQTFVFSCQLPWSNVAHGLVDVNCQQFPLMMIATIPFLRLQKAEVGQELGECPDWPESD